MKLRSIHILFFLLLPLAVFAQEGEPGEKSVEHPVTKPGADALVDSDDHPVTESVDRPVSEPGDRPVSEPGDEDSGDLHVLIPKFYLGFDAFMDNREYFTEYGYHQTLFGARINPGMAWNFGTVHHLHFGINYLMEFGGDLLGISPQLDLFYRYKSRAVDFTVGSFPGRKEMDYPLLAMTDSLNYYRPNLEGASVRYSWKWGTAHAWVDWMGRETPETREAIMAGVDARVNVGEVFYAKALTTRYHLAKTTAEPDTNNIRDDASMMFFLGADLSEKTSLKCLDIWAGYVSTYVYDRPNPYEWGKGWMAQVKAEYRVFGAKLNWYMGDPTQLTYGDQLYSHGDYGRLDIYIDPFKSSRISSKIGWNFHLLPGEGLFHSQQVLISIQL